MENKAHELFDENENTGNYNQPIKGSNTVKDPRRMDNRQ